MGKYLISALKSGILPGLLLLFGIFGFSTTKSDDSKNSLRVVVFKGKDYSFSSLELRRSIRNLKYYNINDEVSSIVVDEGTVARFYRGPDYTACSFEVVGPYKVPGLDIYNCGCATINSNGWDDEISSIQLYSNSSKRNPGIYGKFDNPAKPYPYNTNAHTMDW